ncbi:hypothetical protein EMPS_04514 [Entomortierella parvispora]|uniref:OPT family small oligopeptide transporter n=1 Tax=Entomortierella parvispora TaxID=205924 RepID=A0A9P3LVL5_9FUNG|nr:hypothetical protein EMPS_04514 [Entomortierella parvispora]
MSKEEAHTEKYIDEKVEGDHPNVQLEEEDDSPIEEVRVTISNTDDPSIPCNTFRMWSLGLLWTCVVSFVNQFFYLRQIQIQLGYAVCALLSLPMGHFMAKVLPTRQWNTFGYKWSLNPGPFSIKEHVLIGTMVACNTGTAYAVDIVILQKIWYSSEKTFVAGMFLVLTTQITGFALAGAVRRFLVYPAHMVWPSNLVYASLFRSLHAEADIHEAGRMSRMKYFGIVAFASFCYYWLPGLIFPTLGYIAWICWISPNNIALAQVTGSNGLGIGVIALDWAGATQVIQPMITPWFAQVNVLVGFIVVAWIMVPWAYYTNLWDSKNYPIVSAELFQINGTTYDKSAVLDSNGVLSESLYQAYGPLRMDSFFALTYGVGFAGLTATIVHVALFNGPEIVSRWKAARQETDDIHSRLMRVYPEVPDWWYGLLGVITFALSMVTCVVWDYMPWWALLLAFCISIIFLLPVGVVQAVTNQQPGLNVVTEYLIGYLLPGHAIANVTFKTYGYIVNVQALSFVGDLKLGHYMKIPPRVMFMAQLVSAIISCIINLGTATWLIDTRPFVCDPIKGYPFTCRNTRTFYSASVIWGAIGPARVFGNKDGALYSTVQWGFLVGAILPVITWLLSKKFPNNRLLSNIHWPVLLAATSYMPPALPYMYTNGLFIGFIFAYILRRYRYNWWARYNYLTSAALDTGVAICGLAIFFIVNSWGGAFPEWWGNPSENTPTNKDALDHCIYGGTNFHGYHPDYEEYAY